MTTSEHITDLLRAAEATSSNTAYITLLDSVINAARALKNAAQLAEFGKQFKPAGDPVIDPDAPRKFAVDQKVITKEGYIGTVVGHDKQGRAIVNVVWQACEYQEAQLTAIPDKSVLDSMRA